MTLLDPIWTFLGPNLDPRCAFFGPHTLTHAQARFGLDTRISEVLPVHHAVLPSRPSFFATLSNGASQTGSTAPDRRLFIRASSRWSAARKMWTELSHSLPAVPLVKNQTD